MENSPLHFDFVQDISQVEEQVWNGLAADCSLFVSHAFLLALESSGSVNAESGWQPQHMLIYQKDQLVGMLPLYSKTHSYGEYVFDFAWANAYHQHGLAYYPKLTAAIPFTPVTGERLILAKDLNEEQVYSKAISALQQFVVEQGYSSLHCLFLPKSSSEMMLQKGFAQRRSVQFQWFNKGYGCFDDFIAGMTARRRKSIRKERQKIADSGVTVQRLVGGNITEQDMAFFYQCYQQTYLKRSGHNGYLTQAFFEQILTSMADNLMLVIAKSDQLPVASALYFHARGQLCGRYWGALQDIDGLHFECCYYQGIEFCIEAGLESFNPGTQGEHKILRGFEPIFCYSNHWLKEPAFHHAIERFVEQERPEISLYKEQAATLLPFKQPC